MEQEAAERYTPQKGAAFLTYAVHWIDQSIRRGLSNGHTDMDLIDHVLSLNEALPGDAEELCLLGAQPDPQAADLRRIARQRVEQLPGGGGRGRS